MNLPPTIISVDVLNAARLAVASYLGKADAINYVDTIDCAACDPHVVFEGSTTIKDWIEDFEVIPSDDSAPSNEGEFIGFAMPAGAAFTDLVAMLSGRINDARFDRGITLTGHSRGGAVAWLVAVRLRDIFPSLPLRVITFGAPAPATRAWGRRFAKRGIASLRVEVSYDPIVHAVPWWYGASVGDKLHLDHDGTELAALRGGWATLRYWLKWKLGDLRDHSVQGYADAVGRWFHRPKFPGETT